MPGFPTTEAKSFLHTSLSFFGREFPHFDDVYIHGVRVASFGRGGERVVGLMGGFGVSFGDFLGAFPLSLERDGFLVPVLDGRGDSIHGHDSVHEGERDSGREVSNKDILVGDACER